MSGERLRCTMCDKKKPLDAFHRNKAETNRYGRNTRCKECVRLYNREHKEQRYANNRKWQQANPEKVSAISKSWQLANREKTREYCHRYQARKRGAAIGVVSLEAILARDGYTCHICLDLVAEADLEFDHVVPLSRGGAHSEDNIKVAHSICNRRKGAKILEEMSRV